MIRLLLAEDMRVVRAALSHVLSLESDFEVVAETGRGDHVLREAMDNEPDIAILDVRMPGIDGISAARLVDAHRPETSVLILTESMCPTTFRSAVEAGVSGYLRKTIDIPTLARAIRTIYRGGHIFDERLAASAIKVGPNPLRPRELEVLRLVAGGATVQDCAEALFLAPGTVRNTLRAAVNRLGARSRTDGVRIARECGWI